MWFHGPSGPWCGRYTLDIDSDVCEQLGDELVINAARAGNFTRFINHSCSPNITFHGKKGKKLTKKRKTRKAKVQIPLPFFRTVKDIAAGEELCFDYKFQRCERGALATPRLSRTAYCQQSWCVVYSHFLRIVHCSSTSRTHALAGPQLPSTHHFASVVSAELTAAAGTTGPCLGAPSLGKQQRQLTVNARGRQEKRQGYDGAVRLLLRTDMPTASV